VISKSAIGVSNHHRFTIFGNSGEMYQATVQAEHHALARTHCIFSTSLRGPIAGSTPEGSATAPASPGTANVMQTSYGMHAARVPDLEPPTCPFARVGLEAGDWPG
jgi:hypothetical protein